MEKSLNTHLTKVAAGFTAVRLGMLMTGLLLLSWLFALAPLRDAVLMLPAGEDFSLVVGWWYLLAAPLFNVLDSLSFLSLSQHKVVMLTLLLLPTLLTWCMGRPQAWLKRLFQLFKVFVISLLGVLALYAVAVLMPRPMTALQTSAPDAVLVDFHSHTNYSWDANSLFTPEKNRLWHQKAGFDAAFITDHSSFAGIEEGKKSNPTQAKDGVLLLDGIEAAYHDTAHVMALCASRSNAQEKPFNWTPIVDLSTAGVTSGCKPLLLQATPGPVQDLALTHAAGQGVLAIEIHDAAPAGLEEIKQRSFLLQQAKKFNIAVLYGSDNHGWAFAASAWSVLRIPQWENMDAEQLALAITDTIRSKGFATGQVIERAMLPSASSVVEHVTMPVRLFWHMLQTISQAERLSWLVWTWLLVFIARYWPLRRNITVAL